MSGFGSYPKDEFKGNVSMYVQQLCGGGGAWQFHVKFYVITIQTIFCDSQFLSKQSDDLLAVAFPEVNHNRQPLYEI